MRYYVSIISISYLWGNDSARRGGKQVVIMGMESFAGKLAAVTGGGSGMGRELVLQLATAGCSVAACDVNPQTVEQTAAMAATVAAPGVRVTGHQCDVSDEAQVLRFRDELLEQHASDHVDLVFSNAGIGGGGSFVSSSRDEWERTFAVDWWGVYYCARAFLPLLIASGDGVLVNTSSLNGLWASLGPGMPNNAYCTAKFAIRGFTEALIEDLRTNAPQVRVALVLPGSVGTDIIANTRRAHGMPGPEDMTDEQTEEIRKFLVTAKLVAQDAPPEQVRETLVRLEREGKDKALLSAAEAATIILDGVRSGAWRILVGKDVAFVDERVRGMPESAYDYAELFKNLPADLLRGAKDLPEGVKDLLPEWIKDQLPDAETGG